MTTVFQVRRHGGRSVDNWRCVLSTQDEKRAIDHYNKLHETMRQGGVELARSIDGEATWEVLQRCRAPRLRTRW